MADAKNAPEFPKVMVRVRLGEDGQYESDVRLVDEEGEKSATAEHYIPYPMPASPFPPYPKWVYQAKGAQRRIVQTEDERKKLEGDWGEVPVDEAQEQTDKEKAEREKREHERAPRSAADPVTPESRTARSRG